MNAHHGYFSIYGCYRKICQYLYEQVDSIPLWERMSGSDDIKGAVRQRSMLLMGGQ